MRYDEISAMIAEIGLPYAYFQFPQKTEQAPPFICFLYPRGNDFLADNANYQKIEQLTIELYQDRFEDLIETQVEAVLNRYGMVYARDRVQIESEKLFETIYTMEVLIDA